MSLAQEYAGGRAGGWATLWGCSSSHQVSQHMAAERHVPAWEERTHRHHRPGLLADSGTLSPSETLELESFLSPFLWVSPLVSGGLCGGYTV